MFASHRMFFIYSLQKQSQSTAIRSRYFRKTVGKWQTGLWWQTIARFKRKRMIWGGLILTVRGTVKIIITNWSLWYLFRSYQNLAEKESYKVHSISKTSDLCKVLFQSYWQRGSKSKRCPDMTLPPSSLPGIPKDRTQQQIRGHGEPGILHASAGDNSENRGE